MAQEREYQRVARLIREGLAGRPAGTPLDSERDYEARFKVARGTVRRGLSELETQGWVRNLNGVRTVRNRRRWWVNMTDWERMHRADQGEDAWKTSMLAQGATTVDSDVNPRHMRATESIATDLQIPVGEHIICRDRVHFIDGEPEQLTQSYYAPWVTDGHPEFTDPGDVSVEGGLLAHSGHRQVRYTDKIDGTRSPTEAEAARLHMASSELLLAVVRVGYDAEDRPVRRWDLQAPADRCGLRWEVDA